MVEEIELEAEEAEAEAFRLIRMLRIDLNALNLDGKELMRQVNSASINLYASGHPLRSTFLFKDRYLVLIGHRERVE